jgi:hypothetical protein
MAIKPKSEREKIELDRISLQANKERYLRNCGWSFTCEAPDSRWRWEKEIRGKTYMLSEEDAMHIQEFLEDI